MIKIILLILLFGFISISKKRYLFGLPLKQFSSLFLWALNYEDREKWITDKPSRLPNQKLKPFY